MATQAQIDANRKNAQKSTGPKSPDGKDVTKFNGLKHGLRAEHVVLPGEDPAAFDAELKGWADDWNPQSQTRAVLVERAASASWRLRRCVRAEAARLGEVAAGAAARFDARARAFVAEAAADLDTDPVAALARLSNEPAGVDHLIALADGLLRDLVTPATWTDPYRNHGRLLTLLCHPADADADAVGRLARASLRLIQANDFEDRRPMPPIEARGLADELKAALREFRRDLVGLRAEWEPTEVLRGRAIDAVCVDTSKEGQLQHRYEMAHDRSLRATIKALMTLQKSGADLAERAAETIAPTEPNSVAEVDNGEEVASNPSGEDSSPEGPEIGSGGPSGMSPQADRDRDGRVWPVEEAVSGPPAAPEGR